MSNSLSKFSVIVPIFNEEKTIIKLLNRISETKKQDLDYEIIVINDGSTDNSLKLLKENKNLYDQLITYEKNRGKGYAVKKGLENSRGEYIIFQDADLEYDPKDYNKFIEVISDGTNWYIIGSN